MSRASAHGRSTILLYFSQYWVLTACVKIEIGGSIYGCGTRAYAYSILHDLCRRDTRVYVQLSVKDR